MKYKIKCRFGIHNWDVWQDLPTNRESEHIHIKQIRECQNCKKKQARYKYWTPDPAMRNDANF